MAIPRGARALHLRDHLGRARREDVRDRTDAARRPCFEVFNLLDNANEVEEDEVTGPTYRTMTALQPPRTFRAGVRLAF